MKIGIMVDIVISGQADGSIAAKSASLLYGDMYKFVLEEIVQYQNSPHDGLRGMSPNEKWDEAMEFNLPIVPPHLEKFVHIFWRQCNRKIVRTRKGLAFMGMHYNSNKLQDFPKYHPGTKKENLFTLRFDPVDLSEVAVFCEEKYVGTVRPSELKLPDGSFAKVSVVERELAKHLAEKAGRQNPSRDWVNYIKNLHNTTRDRAEEMRETRDPKAPKTRKTEKSSATSNMKPNALVPRAMEGDSSADYIIVGGSNSDDHLNAWKHKEHGN